ncbi:MAG TPA: ATP-binding protein [Roseiflexaceae bacterium]|nr:ATP-binding protein [Roseiflexaceae bacterium]
MESPQAIMDEYWTILVVDDDDLDRMAVQRALKSAGMPLTIEEAGDSATALALLELKEVDCIFLDYQLPGDDGLTVLREIRDRGILTPVVVLTGQGDEQLAVALMKAGATDYLTKSAMSPGSLRRVLRYAIRVGRAEARAEQARQASRRAAEEQRFLAEASRLLASSLDYTTTLKNLTQLAVPTLADYCIVDIVADDGSVERLAAAHRDPAKQALLFDIQRRYPMAEDAPAGFRKVIHTGEAELFSQVADDFLTLLASTPEHLALLRQLGLRSGICVPLTARGRVLGALTLSISDSGRVYGPSDLALAQDLGYRAAVAIDNARLYHKAQDAVRLRDQFLSIASHELKTPLTALLGNAQMLQRRAAREGNFSERNQRAVQVITDQAMRLNKMIAALLDISRIEMGQLSIDRAPMDLCALARRVVAEMQPTLERHTIAYSDTGAPLVVEGDELRLEQVLHNLISNAVKYSPAGGAVTVQVEQRGSRACVVVSDQGIGIPTGSVPRLFTRFYRADNVDSQNISGMGIGLFVVKEIMTLHGGTIEVTSQEQQGSTFTVCLPLPEPAPATEAEPHLQAS